MGGIISPVSKRLLNSFSTSNRVLSDEFQGFTKVAPRKKGKGRKKVLVEGDSGPSPPCFE